jgi:hypothetical protein
MLCPDTSALGGYAKGSEESCRDSDEEQLEMVESKEKGGFRSRGEGVVPQISPALDESSGLASHLHR